MANRLAAGFLSAALLVALLALPSAAGATSAADWLYEPTTFTEINLTLPPQSVATLEAEPEENYVQGFFSIAETDGVPGSAGPFTDPIEVGVRLKGGEGSFEDLAHKAGFKVKFDEFVEGQTFEGLEKLTLNNMVQDPSMVHETLAYEAFRALGIPAPHTGFAYLRVNGQSYGLHLDIETQDQLALEKQLGPFQNPPQHLYEGENGADVTPVKWEELEVDEGKKKEKGDLKALVDAVALTSPPFSTRVGSLADLGEMTRMWAVERYAGHWDGYSGATGSELPNNYYLYSDAAGKFQMLPWGTDQTWVDPIGFEGSGGVLFNDCTAETGACNSLYRSALGEALQDLNALDFEAMADCVGASLVSWQELEASSSAAMRRPYTVQEMAAGAAEAGDFAADRPAQLATFLGTAAPSPPVPTPCPLLRQRDGHLPPPPPPASAPTPASPTAGESSPASLPTTGARPSIGAVKAHAREIDVNVFAPVAGTLALKGTMAAKTGDALACAGQDQASAGDTLTISCRLTRAARERLGRRWLRLRLTATLASAADQTGSDSRSVRLSRQKPAATA